MMQYFQLILQSYSHLPLCSSCLFGPHVRNIQLSVQKVQRGFGKEIMGFILMGHVVIWITTAWSHIPNPTKAIIIM